MRVGLNPLVREHLEPVRPHHRRPHLLKAPQRPKNPLREAQQLVRVHHRHVLRVRPPPAGVFELHRQFVVELACGIPPPHLDAGKLFRYLRALPLRSAVVDDDARRVRQQARPVAQRPREETFTVVG